MTALAALETLSGLNAKPNIVSAHIYTRDWRLFARFDRQELMTVRPPRIFNVSQLISDGHLAGHGNRGKACPFS